MHLFLPSPRETNFLLLIGFAALGYGLYLRYFVVEAPALEAACLAGLPRAGCLLRLIVIESYTMQLFGGAALVAAVAHFVRPRIATLSAALVAAVLGLILYNTELSALAVGVAVMGFVRPARASMPAPARAAWRQTKAPASSETSH